MIIRPETRFDIGSIRTLVTASFTGAPHASRAEAAIVDGLRDGRALTISLVAEDCRELMGHIAFSPVLIDGVHIGWFGLGPVAVRGGMQRRGIGKAMIEAGFDHLKSLGARGCVVLGDPAFYGRFGFECDPDWQFPGVPQVYFQRSAFHDPTPVGIVSYHAAFYSA